LRTGLQNQPPPSDELREALVRGADNTTRRMAMVGFGTANRKSARGAALVTSLEAFFELGGRLVDTAQMYRNYAEIGRALGKLQPGTRDSVWIVSKVNTDHSKRGFVNTAAGAQAAVRECLKAIGLSVLDVMLIHLPWDNSAAERLAVWRGLIAAQKLGLVRHIGVSNFNSEQIEELYAATGVLPAVNEIEYHPWVAGTVHELVEWCQRRHIVVIAYGSLGGSKNTGQRSAAVAKAAASHGVSNAQVLLSWALQRGVVVIPGATSREHITDNLALMQAKSVRLSMQDARDIEGAPVPRSFKVWKGLCAESNGNGAAGGQCRPSV